MNRSFYFIDNIPLERDDKLYEHILFILYNKLYTGCPPKSIPAL